MSWSMGVSAVTWTENCLSNLKSRDGMIITALSRKCFLFYFLPLWALIILWQLDVCILQATRQKLAVLVSAPRLGAINCLSPGKPWPLPAAVAVLKTGSVVVQVHWFHWSYTRGKLGPLGSPSNPRSTV